LTICRDSKTDPFSRSIAIHGIEWPATFGGIQVAGYQISAPLIALAALYFARRNERLGLAANGGYRRIPFSNDIVGLSNA
jgi:hypothetical protein